MRSKFVYVHTIGCQMNVYDSDRIVRGLVPIGYTPARSMEGADLIILNTCAIREKAQQKAYSFLGRLLKQKRRHPDLIIGVGGCVAQQDGQKLLDRMAHLDFVVGTHAIGRLPKIVQQIASERCRIVDVAVTAQIDEQKPDAACDADGKASRFVTIMRGCNNFCSYCIVPYVRGREISREPGRIVDEISTLVACGVREVTLLGQNVNSYGRREGLPAFPELLAMVNDIAGLERIRFTTSHPKDMSEDLMRAFVTLEKLCNHIHLPVQSGSNRILKRMKRRYTREAYLEKIDRLRRYRPDMAITSDFIVGFPGETDADFEETLDLIRQVRYDALFAFIYSDRPPAPASAMDHKLAESVKKERLQRLFEVQEAFTLEKHRALVGSVQSVMVEGPSRQADEADRTGVRHGRQWMGRTPTNKIVNFSRRENRVAGACETAGDLLQVRIEKAFSHSLWGRPVDAATLASGPEGEKSHAA